MAACFSSFSRQFAITSIILVWCGVARAQYMSDGSSTYIDTWASGSSVYGYGSTNGAMGIHEYAVDITLTSPNGRQASSSGYLQQSWSVSNTVSLSWDQYDLGNYYISTTHRGYCIPSQVAFTISLRNLLGTAGTRQTTFTDPTTTYIPGSCYYNSLACQGSSATCTSGNAITLSGDSCAPYLIVNFLVYTVFFQTSCFPIGVGFGSSSPGNCN